jgi:phospholipase C
VSPATGQEAVRFAANQHLGFRAGEDDVDRRDFLRRGALAGGAAYLGSRVPWALAATGSERGVGPSAAHRLMGESVLTVRASEAPIDTIVVMMMENRSVDHYLGWLGTDTAFLEAGRSRYGRGFRFDGDQTATYQDPSGTDHDTFHLATAYAGTDAYRGCGHPDPGHGWNAGRAQRDHGFLANGSGNDEYAIGYYLSDNLPLYATLARQYGTFDRYHCSVLGPTYPNRMYMHSAQSGGFKTNVLPPETADHRTGFTWPAIWDKLRDQAGFVPGVDAAAFSVDLPPILLWGGRMIPFMQHLEDYFARAVSGTLPKVSFVDPGFTTGMRTDDHPYADVRAGQNLVSDVVKAFMESPQFERGALFITYDEWGGFFDHVAPPRLADDRADDADPGGANDFAQAGFRVPTLMVSPYAMPGFVDHTLYDHTSILRFIEWRYLGAPARGTGGSADWNLTLRDRNAKNIGAGLRSEIVNHGIDLPPQVPVTSAPCPGEELEGIGGPISGVPHPESSGAALADGGGELEWHAFEKALHAGFFEQMGYTPDLRPIPTY